MPAKKKKSEIKNELEKRMKPSHLRRHLGLYSVIIFLIIRFLINMEFTKLSIFFAASYAFFFYLLITKKTWFGTLFIMFLALDNMIGTYLAATKLGFDYIYYGTVIINFIIMFLVIKNYNKHFKK